MEKELFCPLPCSAAGCVATDPIRTVVPHVMVIIRHNCRLYRIPMFIAIIVIWVDHECSSGGMRLSSFHTTAIKSSLDLTRMSPRFNLSVLGLRSLGMPFLCSLNVPQQKIFFWAKSSHRSGEGKKLSMYSSRPNPSTPRQISHCIVCCCQVLCCPLSVFTEVNIHVICISCRVT